MGWNQKCRTGVPLNLLNVKSGSRQIDFLMGRKENIKRMKRLKEEKKRRQNAETLRGIAEKATMNLEQRLSATDAVIRNTNPVKYSEILRQLVAPYLDECTDCATTKELLLAGAAAWNLAVMKDVLDARQFEETVRETKGGLKSPDAFGFIEALMERKDQLYKKHKVIIADVELSDNGTKVYGISVAVTPL
jgi:hypothetical protein